MIHGSSSIAPGLILILSCSILLFSICSIDIVVNKGGKLHAMLSRWSVDFKLLNAGAKTNSGSFEFGRTHVVRPKGRHQATIVWLHGLGDNGARYYIYILISYHYYESYCQCSWSFFAILSC